MSVSLLSSIMSLLLEYSWQNAYRYFGFSVCAFGGLWLMKARLDSSRPLPMPVSTKQLRRELLFSLSTIVLCGALAPVILVAGLGRELNFYSDVGEYGWTYFVFSIFLMMFLRDTIFYWEHRLMHRPEVFRRAHYIHHQSLQTTPLSGFSVHPLEGIFAAALPYALILFLVPKHPTAYLLFVWVDAAVAVITHMGYEPFPKGFARHRVGRWIGTATAHQTHHRQPGRNFGLYFLAWDRWMGTLDKDYERRYDIATCATKAGNAMASFDTLPTTSSKESR